MGINLTEISQKVLDTVSNASNVFRKMYDLHYNPNPIDVPMEYIDENGVKRTTNVPNRSKVIGEFEEWKEGFLWEKNFVSRNLIRDSFVRHLDPDTGKPLYFGARGDVVVEAVHPFTKAFEGPYTEEKPSNAVDDPELATADNPYWFGRENKGPRISRGGLADGWGGISDGNILKITKPANTSTEGFQSVDFSGTRLAATDQIVFEAYVKIVKGNRIGFGADSGYLGSAGGHIVTKEQTLSAPQGWQKVSAIIGTSNVVQPFSSNFLLGFDAADEIEMYMALPTAYILPSRGYKIFTVQED